MKPLHGAAVEDPDLRAYMRDLVALSSIPTSWMGRSPEAIAGSVRDLLVSMLHTEAAYVQVTNPETGQRLVSGPHRADLGARIVGGPHPAHPGPQRLRAGHAGGRAWLPAVKEIAEPAAVLYAASQWARMAELEGEGRGEVSR